MLTPKGKFIHYCHILLKVPKGRHDPLMEISKVSFQKRNRKRCDERTSASSAPCSPPLLHMEGLNKQTEKIWITNPLTYDR